MLEPLVLLPGMMCDGRLFAAQIADFSHERSVMVANLTRGRTMAALADAVLTNTPPRFALAGVSMGGIVAMEMMRQAPDRICKLALLDTNAQADLPENATIRETQVKKVLNGGLQAVIRDEMQPNYFSEGPHNERILQISMEMAKTLGPKIFADQSFAIQHRIDQCETLRTVEVPTLVLCGEDDRLCPLHYHELMRDLIMGSRLEVIPGAGHLTTLEQPKLTNRILKEWLK